MAKKSNIHIRVDENDRAAFMEAAEIGGFRGISDMVRAMVKSAVQARSERPQQDHAQSQPVHHDDAPPL